MFDKAKQLLFYAALSPLKAALALCSQQGLTKEDLADNV